MSQRIHGYNQAYNTFNRPRKSVRTPRFVQILVKRSQRGVTFANSQVSEVYEGEDENGLTRDIIDTPIIDGAHACVVCVALLDGERNLRILVHVSSR